MATPAPTPTPAPAPAPTPAPRQRQRRRQRRHQRPLPAPSGGSTRAGDTFRDCSDCTELVVVPAGSFDMGSPAEYENPVHRVTIAKPFAIGRYEVTFDEWDKCVDEGGCKYRPEDRDWGRGKRPAVNLSWLDAKTFTTWLSQKTGQTYRLPSEAEWEYAARGGANTPTGGAGTSAPAKPTVETAIPERVRRPRRSARIRQTASVFTTRRATWPSGSKIAGTTITAALRTTARPGRRDSVGCADCAAAHSTVKQRICARLRGSDTIRMCDMLPTDFGWSVSYHNSVDRGGVAAEWAGSGVA